MTGEFEVYKDAAGRYRFQFRVGDSVLLRSRAYRSKYNCTVGIASVRICSSKVENFISEQTANGKRRIKLLASNSRVLGVGQDCSLASEYKDKVTLIQRLAPDACINDRTLTVHQIRKIRTARAKKNTRAKKNNGLYRIYAAPRDGRGVYRPRDTLALIVQGFETETARSNYWKKWIHPVTADRAGAKYEYVMCDYPDNGQWRFISERRYSNAKLIICNI